METLLIILMCAKLGALSGLIAFGVCILNMKGPR